MFIEELYKEELELFLSETKPFNYDGKGVNIIDMVINKTNIMDKTGYPELFVKFESDGKIKEAVFTDYIVYFPNLIEELKIDKSPIKNIETIMLQIVAHWRAFLFKRFPDYEKYCKQFVKRNYKADKDFYKFIADESDLKY